MATGEGGKSNFADTGGYGGNFNAGGGGLYNQSASFGGNPTTLSGGVGDYGALAAAASRVNTSASSMNASANAMMKNAGYVLNKNGVWVAPGSYTGLPATTKATPAKSTPPAVAPPIVAPVPVPGVPIPRQKPYRHLPPEQDALAAAEAAGYRNYPRGRPGAFGNTSFPGQPNTPVSQYSGYGTVPQATRSWAVSPSQPQSTSNQGMGWGGMYNDAVGAFGGLPANIGHAVEGLGGMARDYGNAVMGGGRQFGGPVAPGQQYTVGENGPETLQMGANGGGQVIPHNPMDRMGGMNPQMMQQMFQMMRQYGGGQQPGQMGQGGQRIQDWLARRQGRPMPGPGPGGGGQQLPPGPGQMMPPAQGPGTGGGGWGFGGSGMGVPGIMSRFGGQARLG